MILDPQQLLIFVPAALALNLTPGNDMLFCLGQGIRSGPRAGIAASLGIATGAVVHTRLAGAGLAGLLAANPAAFEAIRWAGIAYLVWLAIGAVRGGGPLQPSAARPGGAFAAWRDGMVVNLLNPKVIVFMFAFLPQFVDPARGSPFLQFLLLGAILNIGGTAINGLVGGFAGSIGRVLAGSRRVARAFELATGAVFLALAARLALDRR